MSGRDTPDASGVRKLLYAQRVDTDRFAANNEPKGPMFAARRLFRFRGSPCGKSPTSKQVASAGCSSTSLIETLRSLEKPEGHFPLTPDFARGLDPLRRETGNPEGRTATVRNIPTRGCRLASHPAISTSLRRLRSLPMTVFSPKRTSSEKNGRHPET